MTGPGCVLDADTEIEALPGTEDVAQWLRATIGAATGLPLPPYAAAENRVVLRLSPEAERQLGPEGYRLVTEGPGVLIEAGSGTGLFWGAQTLRQLLGPAAFRRAPVDGGQRKWPLPALRIEDTPRFAWRGMMLDVARHFMPKDGVLRYLDLLAAHKLNVLHLHLTDDQGWRIEIPRYPALTEVGGWRERTKLGHRASPLWDERPHGGFYTQDDLREIVAYAAARHITVVPEIDIPGHSQAAIAAYPELGNTDVLDTARAEGLGHLGRQPQRPRPHRPHPALLRARPGGGPGALPLAVRAHRRRRVPQGPVAGLAHRPGAGSPSWGWPTRTRCRAGSSGTSTAGSPTAGGA